MNTHELWLRVSTRSRGLGRLGTHRRRLERGASAVEYGLLIAGVAALIVIAVFAFGGGSSGLFQNSCETIMEANSVGSCT
jgi:pilus assembly protein Flp/PilA